MAVRLSTHELHNTLRDRPRLPFSEAELAAIRLATPAIAQKLVPRFEPADGLLYLVADSLHMDFVLSKTLRHKTIFGAAKPRFTVWMGFEHGEFWEEGPSVNNIRGAAYVFQRMQAADNWLDSEYGRKR